ncbi:hypothetical protein M011DRAFT_474794 [Sporormia fimetaria CBS 119925]|uniref:NADH dehydrogenase [ubiquinone] 1 beta subcomplex subunit 11, mitochondrial n=1 Tax=Sporormia fimetaria CBS 119925 TaxID=1340428 RepID=A0A6A6VI96_9PLEO|nr:hypothetical protein M011DRAFT_474794 [Sporormia fimetaria CBS 119925]
MTPLLRSRVAALTQNTLRSSRTAAPARAFSRTAAARGGNLEYDPPTGELFGTPAGQKRKREDWELIFYIGFFGSFAFAAIAYQFKPDTSIQTWALEEARRRLEAEGILPDADNVTEEED